MDTELIGYLGAMEQRIVSTLRGEIAAVQESLRGEMQAGQEALREEMWAGHESLRGEIAAVQESLTGKIATVEESLRGEIAAAQDSLRGEIRTVHESLTAKIAAVEEKLLEENRGIRMLFESLQADVRAVWAEGVAAITEGQNRRLEELREHFDVRVGALEAVARSLSRQVQDHEGRISALEGK